MLVIRAIERVILPPLPPPPLHLAKSNAFDNASPALHENFGSIKNVKGKLVDFETNLIQLFEMTTSFFIVRNKGEYKWGVTVDECG